MRGGFLTTTNEAEAVDAMRARNRAAVANGRSDMYVLVDGPEDGEFTVMPLADAVEGEFLYRWER